MARYSELQRTFCCSIQCDKNVLVTVPSSTLLSQWQDQQDPWFLVFRLLDKEDLRHATWQNVCLEYNDRCYNV